MIDVKRMRTVLFVLCVAGFSVLSAFYLSKEKSYCLGVPFINENGIARIGEYSRTDLQNDILFMDMPVAVDTQSDTVYISQNMDGTTLYTELEGELTAKDEKYPLYFAKDAAFDDFPKAVEDGHRFSLIVDTLDGKYMKYNVVFTNLPVIKMSGEKAYVNSEKRRVYAGDVTVWDPEYEKTGKYCVQSSLVEWHRRGGSTLTDDKKSWKLALKNADGTNNDLEFLGLEDGDDDWILNAIHRDDTKIREKLVMSIWNRYCDTAVYNHKMSAGRYAEVVNNGQYCGLYLLQRRIDGKYLELEDEILLKSIKATEGLPIEFFYDIIYPRVEQTERDDPLQDNLSDDERYIYSLVEPFHNEEFGNLIDMDNWMDVSLLIDFGYMSDNTGAKNIFYLLDDGEDGLKIKQILWDTDYSFGIGYSDGFAHKPESAATGRRERREADYLRQLYPDFEKMMAERWFKMRTSIFKEENIYSVMDDCVGEITLCGAYGREKELWGSYYNGGTDTIEALYDYIEKRIEYLDSVHRENLRG